MTSNSGHSVKVEINGVERVKRTNVGYRGWIVGFMLDKNAGLTLFTDTGHCVCLYQMLCRSVVFQIGMGVFYEKVLMKRCLSLWLKVVSIFSRMLHSPRDILDFDGWIQLHLLPCWLLFLAFANKRFQLAIHLHGCDTWDFLPFSWWLPSLLGGIYFSPSSPQNFCQY